MIMSSVQRYFDFGETTECGIPGVEMKGTLADWKQLVVKTENLQSLLQPMIDELGLQDWFIKTLDMLKKLVETFEGNPDKGQLISECPFGIIVWTKIPTKLFLDFCPEIFCIFLGASWKLFRASCRLPCL